MISSALVREVLAAQKSLTQIGLGPGGGLNFQELEHKAGTKLAMLGQRRHIKIGYAGWGLDQTLSFQQPSGRQYTVVSINESQLGNVPAADLADVFLVNHHFIYDLKARENLKSAVRDASRPVVVIFWLVDHHHMFEFCLEHCGDFDYYCRSHYFGTDYLSVVHSNCIGTLPCPVMQWNLSQLDGYASRHLTKQRSDALYGGFRAYGHPREQFARLCQETIVPHNIYLQTLEESQTTGFFAMDGDQRFSDWCNYKVSLVLPVRNDMPSRIFDALLTGQIPIVADDVVGLDTVIPADLQLSLPVFAFQAGDVHHLQRVHKLALATFDRGGSEGIANRYAYARKYHTVEARLRLVASLVENRVQMASQL